MPADLSALFGWRCQAPDPDGHVCGGRLYACAADDLAHVELYCGASLYSPSRSHRIVLPRPLPDSAADLRAAVELHRQRIRSLGHHPTHGAGNPWDHELWAALDGTSHSGWEQFRGQIVSVHSAAVVISVPPVVVAPPVGRPVLLTVER